MALVPKQKFSKPLSVVATRIVQEALRDDVELSALTRLAEADPAFALRVVSGVNSSAFALPRKVSDVRQACSLLGIRGLRNLALSLVVSDMIPRGPDGSVLLANSLRRAVAGRLLAEAIGEKQPDEHFTAGLFLEIGLLHAARADIAAAAEVARMPALHRVTYERACGRPEHPTAGAELAATLKLPDALVEAVQNHHAPKPPESALGRVAWTAERVAAVFEGGDVTRNQKTAVEAAQALALHPAATTKLIEKLPALVAETARAFDRDVAAQEDVGKLVADANKRLVELNVNYEQILRRMEQLLSEKEQLTIQLQRANAELANVAATDPLTGLPNRRSFEEAVKRDFARALRNGTAVALVMVDVDHFKKVNDTFGHATGDQVLRAVADVLRSALRTGDIPARFGGEEFVAILPGSDADGGRTVAERIRALLAAHDMPGPNGAFRVTASVGVASASGAACRDAEAAVLARADAALYEAKRSGRNRVVVAQTAQT
ncbi:MAG TPA: diguanylate cyclase [Polyangiaceae bacterium]|nr:diguanylate cyclase [Polyangiaceae bacterium]